MSLREFINFAKTKPEKKPDDISYVNIKGNVVYIEGKRAVIINKDLRRKIATYIQNIIKIACEAMEKEGYIIPVFAQNKKEVRYYQNIFMQAKARLENSKV